MSEESQPQTLGASSADLKPIHGIARVDPHARKLAARLEPGDIAVIDFRDLDRATAQAFVSAGAAAVLNAAPSMSGRYPNLGPLVLLESGICLLDDLGADIMTVKEGASITINFDEVSQRGRVIATGHRVSLLDARETTNSARNGFATQIRAFAETTGEYLEREASLLLNGSGLPDLPVDLQGKVVLLVLDDSHSLDQLRKARPWIRDTHPVVIAVDGGGDIAVKAGLRPHLIVGDMELVPEKLLRSRAEILIGLDEKYTPGIERLKRMGISHHEVSTSAPAADLAMLYASLSGASAIVTAGEHTTFEDFLDRGRTGMAASFFTRLRAGGQLIALPAVMATYRHRIRSFSVVMLILSAVIALGAAFFTTPLGYDLFQQAIDLFTSPDLPASSGTTL